MARLIDADKLLTNVIAISNSKGQVAWSAVSTIDILAAPTVDAVPVVRCKDCKHFRHYGKTSLFINGKNIKAGWCQRRIRYDEECRMTVDDFCSYGERKDGDGNG